MECIKKLHDTVETLDTLGHNCLNCIKCLMQIFTSSVVRHIMPLQTLFFCVRILFRHLHPCFSRLCIVHLCTVCIARIVSDSLEIPWWFVSGYATHCLPKQPLTFIYCLIYSLPLGGGPAKNRDVNQRSVCRPKKRRARHRHYTSDF